MDKWKAQTAKVVYKLGSVRLTVLAIESYSKGIVITQHDMGAGMDK